MSIIKYIQQYKYNGIGLMAELVDAKYKDL